MFRLVPLPIEQELMLFSILEKENKLSLIMGYSLATLIIVKS